MSVSFRHFVFTKHFTIRHVTAELGDQADDMPIAQIRDETARIGRATLQSLPTLLRAYDKVSYGIAQLEKSAAGVYHLQGYIELSDKITRPTLQRKLPFLSDAHVDPRRGTRDEARNYASKTDTRIDGPVEYGTWQTVGQGRRSDINEFAKAAIELPDRTLVQEYPGMYLRYGNMLQRVRAAAEDPVEDREFQPKPWQQQVIDLITAAPDSRTIIWVYDPAGGQGKSRLAYHLSAEHGAILLSGKIADMAYAYDKQRIVMFDLSRTQAEHSDQLYTFAEQLKNGMLFSAKYESRQKIFKPPHVIFFSNSMPAEGKWTRDRLKLIRLNGTAPAVQRETVIDLTDEPTAPAPGDRVEAANIMAARLASQYM